MNHFWILNFIGVFVSFGTGVHAYVETKKPHTLWLNIAIAAVNAICVLLHFTVRP